MRKLLLPQVVSGRRTQDHLWCSSLSTLNGAAGTLGKHSINWSPAGHLPQATPTKDGAINRLDSWFIRFCWVPDSALALKLRFCSCSDTNPPNLLCCSSACPVSKSYLTQRTTIHGIKSWQHALHILIMLTQIHFKHTRKNTISRGV